MSSLIQLLKKYPLEIFLSLAFAALLMRFPETAMANLFILVSIVVSCYLIMSNLTFLKYTGPAILLGSLIMYSFLAHGIYAYWFISLSIVFVVSMVFASMKFGANKRQIFITQKVLIFGLALMVLMPASYSLSSYLAINHDESSLVSASKSIENKIGSQLEGLKSNADRISKDPFIATLSRDSSYVELNGYLQNLMVSEGLNYLAIADQKGDIVGRAHQSNILGDNLESMFPGQGKSEGIGGIFNEYGQVYIIRSQPLTTSDGQKVGELLVGMAPDTDINLTDRAIGYIFNNTILDISGNHEASNLLNAISNHGITLIGSNNLVNKDNINFVINKFHSSKYNLDIVGAKRLSGYRYIYLANILLYLFGAIAIYWLTKYYRVEKPVKAHQNVVKRLKENYRSIALVGVELITIGLVVFTLANGNAREYLATGSKTIESPKQIAPVPSLSLDYRSLAKVGELSTIQIKLNNLPTGAASVKTVLRFAADGLTAENIDYSQGICDKVFDKNIDNVAGLVTFSCVLKYNSNSSANLALAEIRFKPKKLGLALFSLDQADTSIRTGSGDSDKTDQTFSDGEKMIVGK